MSLNLIVAQTRNRVIGANNRLLWHLPNDLRRFKELTQNNVVLMGRKTYESIGKPLPNRVNIVVSRNHIQNDSIVVIDNIFDAIGYAKHYEGKQTFVIGGQSIYEQTLPFITTIYSTLVDFDVKGDTYLPEMPSDFELVKSKQDLLCTFQTFKRRFV